ncbi:MULTISPECIES: VOC family protein [Streptomyces]|uniref:VOC family protein n=1 Tax=Streptomyces TaxID=1883 RepID=UPI00068F4D0C|nr:MULTISPECIES: VOC family protein [Streptomyces]QHF93152.1 VOC family protein [Streptomyces sp. NHF165]
MALSRMGLFVLDCPDPAALARFYAGILGWTVDDRGDGEWVEVTAPQGGRLLAFQRAPDHVPPRWPSGEHSQQAHLDLYVDRERWDEAEQEALGLGARLVQPDEGERDFRVYLDPAGHPFCLCVQTPDSPAATLPPAA